jgi:hypothetical protein
MPSNYNSPFGAKHWQNGVFVKDIYNEPNDTLIGNNAIRMLKEGQAVALAQQSAADGIALVSIPDARFHLGVGSDINSLACHVVTELESNATNEGGSRDLVKVSVVVTVESTDPYIWYPKAKSYIAAFRKILRTAAITVPKEFAFGWNGQINIAFESYKIGLTDQLNQLLARQLGVLPIFELTLSIIPEATR